MLFRSFIVLSIFSFLNSEINILEIQAQKNYILNNLSLLNPEINRDVCSGYLCQYDSENICSFLHNKIIVINNTNLLEEVLNRSNYTQAVILLTGTVKNLNLVYVKIPIYSVNKIIFNQIISKIDKYHKCLGTINHIPNYSYLNSNVLTHFNIINTLLFLLQFIWWISYSYRSEYISYINPLQNFLKIVPFLHLVKSSYTMIMINSFYDKEFSLNIKDDIYFFENFSQIFYVIFQLIYWLMMILISFGFFFYDEHLLTKEKTQLLLIILFVIISFSIDLDYYTNDSLFSFSDLCDIRVIVINIIITFISVSKIKKLLINLQNLRNSLSRISGQNSNNFNEILKVINYLNFIIIFSCFFQIISFFYKRKIRNFDNGNIIYQIITDFDDFILLCFYLNNFRPRKIVFYSEFSLIRENFEQIMEIKYHYYEVIIPSNRKIISINSFNSAINVNKVDAIEDSPILIINPFFLKENNEKINIMDNLSIYKYN